MSLEYLTTLVPGPAVRENSRPQSFIPHIFRKCAEYFLIFALSLTLNSNNNGEEPF